MADLKPYIVNDNPDPNGPLGHWEGNNFFAAGQQVQLDESAAEKLRKAGIIGRKESGEVVSLPTIEQSNAQVEASAEPAPAPAPAPKTTAKSGAKVTVKK